ncbi:hypothetical protein [Pseudomonas phage vB_PaeM_PAO1_Ab04]|uniref:Uncharacterized protein n=1 Tax=Pseudomonas phage vB_PaeM_PAO1_Ab04 TaxID=1548909 RepID=A0A0C7TBZ0_9CAUD|nr:hypothetical protein [Pseudomonas phage vB_PaeM_PAO1_Ab04]
MMENRNGAAEAACPKCGGSGHADSGGVQSWGEPISIPCDCLTEQEEFLAWANEEYEVEEGYELNESNPAVMENKKGWMARAALPKRSKFRQHLDECADEVDTWPSYKREALKNPSPKCSTCHDQGEVFIGPGKVESHMLEEPEPIYAPCPDCEQPSPLQSEQAEAERLEVIRVPSCENSYGFGYVDGSCHVDLRKYRNHLEDILDSLPNDEPLMTVSQHERIVEALRFERQQMDRAFTTCINERNAALTRVAELEAKLAELEKQKPLLHINPLVVDELLGRAKRSPGGLTWSKEPCGPWTLPLYTAPAQAQHSVPDVCDGKEQDAFEEWAKKEGLDTSCHPMHWLFLDAKTNSARQGWKAALRYVRAQVAAPGKEVGHE